MIMQMLMTYKSLALLVDTAKHKVADGFNTDSDVKGDNNDGSNDGTNGNEKDCVDTDDDDDDGDDDDDDDDDKGADVD